MSATNLGLDSLAHPLWLVTANLLGDSIAILDIDRFVDVLMHYLTTLIGDLSALLEDDLLLPDLLHLDALFRGYVVAVLHRHHLRPVLFNNLAILCWLFYAMLPCVASRGFRVDLNGFALFVVTPRPGVLGLSSVTFHLRTFLADVVLVAVALLKHRGADVASAS